MTKKILISEKDVRRAWQKNEPLEIPQNFLLTPLAKDTIKELKVEVCVKNPNEEKSQTNTKPNFQTKSFAKVTTPPSVHEISINWGKIAIGSDHGGFAMKEFIKNLLTKGGYEVLDFGTNSTEAVDYPDFAEAVALSVARKESSAGIMIDSVGVASAMVCNKVKGIRAAVCNDIFTANSSREHNNANVLTLGGKIIGEALASEIVKLWLTTNFTAGRHQKRVDKIHSVEAKY